MTIKDARHERLSMFSNLSVGEAFLQCDAFYIVVSIANQAPRVNFGMAMEIPTGIVREFSTAARVQLVHAEIVITREEVA